MQYRTLSVQDGFIRASGLECTTNIVPASWLIEGFDADAILAALQHVVDRHESLRTAFAPKGDGYVQIVGSVADVSRHVEVLDLTDGDAEDAMSWLMGESLADPFDLRTPPVWRGFLAKLAERRWVLALAFAHVIVDGYSVSVFAIELANCLGGASLPRPRQLGELARAEHAIVPTTEQAAWWTEQYERRRGIPDSWGGGQAHFRVHPLARFEPEVVRGLTELAELSGASIATVFGCLFAAAMTVVRRDRPLMMGFASARRDDANRSTIGAVHDHRPALPAIRPDRTFAAFAGEFHERRREARSRSLPSGALEAISRRAGSLSTPYDGAVNYSPFLPPAAHPVPGGQGTVRTRPIPTIGPVGVYRATNVAPAAFLILRPHADGALSGDVTGISAIFSAREVRSVGLRLAWLARRVVRAPETPLWELMG